MYKIKFYRDRQGKQPVKDYFDNLRGKKDKDNRIKRDKIDLYLETLSKYGTRAGEKYTKHIEGDIWELRPLDDRVFFFYWNNDAYILLHYFHKKTQKTPRKEIDQAKRNLKDFLERSIEDDE